MNQLIPRVLWDVLESELEPGERLVWCAQPAPANLVLGAAGTFLFGIPFFSFAVFWTWSATHGFNAAKRGADSMGWFGVLWGGMFVLAGAAMLLSPLWAWRVARHTVYAITNRRALVIERPLGRAAVQSLAADRLTDMIRREAAFGRGDLIFERVVSKGSKGRTVFRDVGFFGLEDVRAVSRLLPTPAGVDQ